MSAIDRPSHFTFSLDADEICVIAGFLKIPVMYGVTGNFFRDWQSSPKKRVRETARRLENRGLIRCGLDGVVDMTPALYECFQCIKDPQWMFDIRTRDKKSVIDAAMLYGNNHSAAMVAEQENGRYEVCWLFGVSEIQSVLQGIQVPVLPEEAGSFYERISVSTILESRRLADSFDRENAEKCMEEGLSEKGKDRMEEIWKILGGTVPLTVWDFRKRVNRRMKVLEGCCFVQIEQSRAVQKGCCSTGMELSAGIQQERCFTHMPQLVYQIGIRDDCIELTEKKTASVWKRIGKWIVGGEIEDECNYCNGDR
ncbi:MAG: hypothetical protein MR308_11250 [Lachnospiraceae bacterium]|nr:hypothetical protein [Lachnospiraceae bacterium]